MIDRDFRFDIVVGPDEKFLDDAIIRKLCKEKYPNDSDYIACVKIMQEYARKGEHVYCEFNGCLLRSKCVDPNKPPRSYDVYSDPNASLTVKPFKSLDDIETSLQNLGDYRDPRNRNKWLIIMYQLSQMIDQGFNTDLAIDGITGKFKGQYPSDVDVAIDMLVTKYFPANEEIFAEKGLRPELQTGDKQQDWLYTLIGNAVTQFGIGLLAERGPLDRLMNKSGVHFVNDVTYEDVRRLTVQAKEFLNFWSKTP